MQSFKIRANSSLYLYRHWSDAIEKYECSIIIIFCSILRNRNSFNNHIPLVTCSMTFIMNVLKNLLRYTKKFFSIFDICRDSSSLQPYFIWHHSITHVSKFILSCPNATEEISIVNNDHPVNSYVKNSLRWSVSLFISISLNM